MDERVMTAEGRAALVDELRVELTRGPQPTHTTDLLDEPLATLFDLWPPDDSEATDEADLELIDDEDWQKHAVCVADPRATNGETKRDIARAQAMCQRCPVLSQCRAWADSELDFEGVAGGLVYGDRRSKSNPRGKAA
jgi:WhiB family redox-sensing transcriptional regulator